NHGAARGRARGRPAARLRCRRRSRAASRLQRRARALHFDSGAPRRKGARMSDILALSLTEIAAAIRKKKISSLEATRACFERIHQIQPKTNCFIAIEEEEALKAARAADRMRGKSARLGPLHGVPLAHKDMYYRKGRLTTGGSKVLRDNDYRPGYTAT